MFVLLPALSLLLFVVALIDIITRDQSQVRHLPKTMWVIIVILIPLIGSILWFAIGRDWGTATGGVALPVRRATPAAMPEPLSFGQFSGQGALSTEEQLAELDREIEFYEKRAQVERLQRELEEKRKAAGE
ncbi:PLDc N-terminal domain-containing protein [Leifsonia sp. NPDC058248]|uniref:PLDc N-terminal domain-containing protein n=1 Tax=Leifsonia sp. NPDC058248 TaxID=3346402 RepID=UPI0036DEC6D9